MMRQSVGLSSQFVLEVLWHDAPRSWHHILQFCCCTRRSLRMRQQVCLLSMHWHALACREKCHSSLPTNLSPKCGKSGTI